MKEEETTIREVDDVIAEEVIEGTVESDQAPEHLDFQIPQVLPVLPLRNTVVFPQQIIPISVGREKSIKLIE